MNSYIEKNSLCKLYKTSIQLKCLGKMIMEGKEQQRQIDDECQHTAGADVRILHDVEDALPIAVPLLHPLDSATWRNSHPV